MDHLLIIFSGRTGRIGNVGLATSFYNNRDSDLAPVLVKTMLETRQVIPDFLQEHIPEGFTADGQGDITKLDFEVSSPHMLLFVRVLTHSQGEDDAGDFAGGDFVASGDVGGNAWGGETSTPVASSGWGAAQPSEPVVAPVVTQAPPQQSSWNAPVSQPPNVWGSDNNASGGWGSAAPSSGAAW